METTVSTNPGVDSFFDTPSADPLEGRLAGDSIFDTGEAAPFAESPTPTEQPLDEPQPSAEEGGKAGPEQSIDFAAENRALKQQLAELSLYKPLGEMIQRNPNFLSAVESSLKSMQAEAPPPKLERPAPPQKPAAYDPQEAISVPGSESWKYREACDTFNNEMFAYYEKRDAMREEAQTQALQAYQNQMAQAQAHQQLTNELMTHYGYTKERVEDFIRVMSDPESRSIQNLVALHAMQTQKQASQRSDALKVQQKNVPLPVGVIGGGGSGQTQKITDSDAFNIGLLSARR